MFSGNFVSKVQLFEGMTMHALLMATLLLFPQDQPKCGGGPECTCSTGGTVELTPCPAVITMGLDNPELEVRIPFEGGFYPGFFVVETRNISYRPELATNPVTQFAVGVDANNDPLVQNDGHIHGWVFRLDRFGNIIRNDKGRPVPTSYLRFYVAGGAEFFGNEKRGYYYKTDDLPRGRYRAYFQAQQNDHTAMQQATAPAFPAIASVDFWVW
jgi:hypothetical protein